MPVEDQTHIWQQMNRKTSFGYLLLASRSLRSELKRGKRIKKRRIRKKKKEKKEEEESHTRQEAELA